MVIEKQKQWAEIVEFIKDLYHAENVPLHVPRFIGKEKEYLARCIDSTFVSYLGEYVSLFEKKIQDFVGCRHAVATTNGTNALHIALMLVGVQADCDVLTPALTFVATTNAIAYLSAQPVFVDADRETLGMNVGKLAEFLENHAVIKDDGHCYNKQSRRRIGACVPVHIFGHPARITEIQTVCQKYHVPVVEDAAESLGSTLKGQHTGTFAPVGVLSFNGNKIVTTGGGGMIITNDEALARRARHLTTTAKIPHPWEYIHDQVGYNFRLPNVNAAVGVAQMESLPFFIQNKRELAALYQSFFEKRDIPFFKEREETVSNYWLNAILLNNREERDAFLQFTNTQGVMTRPAWRLMYQLAMYKDCQRTNMDHAEWLEDRLVNLPSSVRV